MKLAKKLTVTSLVLLIGTAFASEVIDAEFDKLLKANKINPVEEQSYCYTDEAGKVQGKNVDMQVRLASVSKLLTSLWAIEKKGPDFRYDTKLFIKGSLLHIQGSFDPFMSNEKMLFLVSELNRLGHGHFDKITYDKIVQINPGAQTHTDAYPLITRESNGKYIKLYFNTASWSKSFKAEYDRLASLAKKGRFQKEVNFSVDTVEFSEKNPLGTPEENADVKMLTLTSPKLFQYLKEINVKSNNYSSHTIFRDLGGEEEFAKFAAEKFSLTREDLRMYNGSGLPSTIEGKRFDNFASCAIIANLTLSLKESLERQGKKLEDVVAVPGSDLGTFSNRLNSSDFKNTFVAKTGTLMHTSTLAGALSTAKGFSFFGIYNQTTDIIGSKKVQNEMVKVLMNEMGGPKIFGYKVEGFHAYDNNEFVKNFNLFDEEEVTDFSTVEGSLH